MNKLLKKSEVFLLMALAVTGVIAWIVFALPRLQVIDLNVSQNKAIRLATSYLNNEAKIDTSGFTSVAILDEDAAVDRYLQKNLGINGSKELLDRLHYDLFTWVVRFFKEKQKEEFKVFVSSKTGQVIGLKHDLDETAVRPNSTKEDARNLGISFLKLRFDFDPEQYIIFRDNAKKYDHRVDYTFSFQDKTVEIPWKGGKEKSSAKLLTTVVVSGQEVLSFAKQQFDIPEGFDRNIDNLKQTGQSLSLLFKILYLGLLTLAIMFVINRKHHAVPRIVKPMYIRCAIFIFILMVLESINGYQSTLFDYSTAQSLFNFLLRYFVESLISPLFVVLAFIMPALAGEALHFEVDPQSKHRALLSSVKSSFLNRPVAVQIIIGYLIAWVVLGCQSVVFHIGHVYWGVWDELSWLTQTSTNVFPALTALLIGVQAALSEEAMFRLFAINFLKKYSRNIGLAVFVSAMIWGFGHTGYAVFPMWFRGLEVTCIGIILGIAYLRYGLITVIVAHFFMDSFLTSLPYLLKPYLGIEFMSSLLVICVPMIFAVWSLKQNKSLEEREREHTLNVQQQFNYELLVDLCQNKTESELRILYKNLLHHGWDPVVVNRAFKERG